MFQLEDQELVAGIAVGGPNPDSDLDLILRDSPGLKGSRHQARVEQKIKEIIGDFTDETGIKVDANARWLYSMFEWISIFGY